MSRSEGVTILGVVRNGGTALSQTLDRIDDLCHRLSRSSCILATNDNSDETDTILEAFAKNAAGTKILRLDGLVQSHPTRVERIALARNMTLAAMWQQETHPHALVIDMDGPNARLPIERILEVVREGDEATWDGLFANQLPCYYDIYALRHPVWCPLDPWREVKRWRRRSLRLIPRKRLLSKLVYERQFSISPNQPRISVTSAFGGLGLYRSQALRHHWYNARTATGDLVCEHVTLHQAMVANGKRLFIDPAMINEAPAEHLGTTSGRPFPGFDDR